MLPVVMKRPIEGNFESARTVYSVMACILSPCKTGPHMTNLVPLRSAGFIKSSKNVLS